MEAVKDAGEKVSGEVGGAAGDGGLDAPVDV